jgi:flavin reductase (DIM6/NTAB) family NADH-FMN oxidoreductase RutF
MLGSGQEAIARQFASSLPPIVHWQGVEIREGEIAPLIEGALGWIEARVIAEHDVGDHTFFVGAVIVAEQGPSTSALVYRDREYHAL